MTSLAAPLPHARHATGAVVAVVLGAALLSATLARLTGYATPPAPPPIVAARALSFTDLGNGGVAVKSPDGARIATIPARGDGFLRMTLRLLAAARMRRHIGPREPFELTEFAGGRLQLRDPATGLHVELEAFGPSNEAEFIALMRAKP